MSTVDFTLGSGLEQLGASLLLVLARGLNTQLAAIDAERNDELAALYDQLDRAFDPIISDPVPNDNFHLGHRPSLIDADASKLPNVSVMGSEALPRPMNVQIDQGDAIDSRIYVELFAKAGPVAVSQLDKNEPVVNSMIQRMVDAAIRAINADRTLGGSALGFTMPPTVMITDVQVKHHDAGDIAHLWQGARLEYVFDRYASY